MIVEMYTGLKKMPLIRHTSRQLRWWRQKWEISRVFQNYNLYLQALQRKGEGTVLLRTRDGLGITIRQNLWDARIIREIFFDKPYVRHITLPNRPVIIDVGGYIGDFSLYAAKYLNARRVVVYEPTVENFRLLTQNIENNGFADRITAVNKAVSSGHEIVLNVQIQESEEMHVSAYWYKNFEQRTIPSVTLPEILETHRLDSIDLLKIDCEGGEYDILPAVPGSLFKRIRNIVFEYHEIDGYESRLKDILKQLQAAGYALRTDGKIVSASIQF
jgi:FkbM family methyltransferase